MAMEVGGTCRSSAPTLTDGQKKPLRLDTAGALVVSGSIIPVGSGQTTASASQSVVPATDAGPAGKARLLSSVATTNATSVKGSAGSLFKIIGNNTVASKRYLKLYNKATAPTVGTDTPVLTIVLLASAAFDFDLPAAYFSTGIGYAITGAAADADTTAIGVGDIECLDLVYA